MSSNFLKSKCRLKWAWERGFLAYYSYLYLVILNNKRQSGQNDVILYHETIYITYNVGKVVIWASHPNIIAFSKLNNGKYDNQLLIWKVLSFLCTLSWLHLLYQNYPSVSPTQHHSNLHIPFSHLKALFHLFSLLKTQNLSFQFTNSNPKLQDSVKMCLSACLGVMGV